MILEERTARKMKSASIKCALALPLVAGILLPSYQSSDASIHARFMRQAAPMILQAGPDPAARSPEERTGCPPDMSRVSTFCIDRFEAHLSAGGAIHPHNLRPPAGTFKAEASGCISAGLHKQGRGLSRMLGLGKKALLAFGVA
jgi:hypothetical protein